MATGPALARVVAPCVDLQETIDFFCDRLGFTLDAIWPADDPAHALVCLEAVTVELRRGAADAAPTIVVPVADPAEAAGVLTAPGGARIELVSEVSTAAPVAPVCELVVSHLDAQSAWVTGRAGMRYRDLVPDRLGGRLIASHIEIPDGGQVPDYVHFHDIEFQMIFCAAGWVRVVYEDQGEPFVLNAGDCVLQPPLIRHRVLEASPGLEVIEIGGPAEHLTRREHGLELPTAAVRSDRQFGGQRFVRHVAAGAATEPWRGGPLRCRNTGIDGATNGVVDVRIAGASGIGSFGCEQQWTATGSATLLLYVLAGAATLQLEHRPDVELRPGTTIVVPSEWRFRIAGWTPDLEILDVAIDPATSTHAGVMSGDDGCVGDCGA